MISALTQKNLLLLGLVVGELAILSFVFIGLDHFIYPALIATILLYIATPAIEALVKNIKIPKSAAIFLIFSLQVLLIGYLLFSILPALITEARNLLQTLPSSIKKSLEVLNSFATQYDINLIPDLENIEKTSIEQLREYLQSDATHILKPLSISIGVNIPW